jgi:hypothetical protein
MARIISAVDAHAVVHNAYSIQRHLVSRRTLRQVRAKAVLTWELATAA